MDVLKDMDTRPKHGAYSFQLQLNMPKKFLASRVFLGVCSQLNHALHFSALYASNMHLGFSYTTVTSFKVKKKTESYKCFSWLWKSFTKKNTHHDLRKYLLPKVAKKLDAMLSSGAVSRCFNTFMSMSLWFAIKVYAGHRCTESLFAYVFPAK